jgi:branched-chain amino acid transport system substrate-binding protein
MNTTIKRSAIWPEFISKGMGMLMVALFVLSACRGDSNTATATKTNLLAMPPIKIGVSISRSGEFARDSKATKQGYQLWVDTVNRNGGLLGREVQLIVLPDDSSTTQVAANYQQLITVTHVDLVFGPYSTRLTNAASLVANHYGYVMLEGSGGGPSVFSRGLRNIFDVSRPIVHQMDNFVQYILSLPPEQKPQTVAYATEDDPFTQPMIDQARQFLQLGGVRTVSYQVYSHEITDYTPIAQKVIAAHAQLVVLGSQISDTIAFVQTFKQQHYNPEALIISAGPDQGSQFTRPIGGAAVAEGIFFPDCWDPGINTYQNAQMVKDYLKQYGGTIQQISANTAEAYAAGQVLYQAVNQIHSINNTKLIAELHSDTTFQSLQGDVSFNDEGENIGAVGFTFQWQKEGVVLVYPPAYAQANPEYPKPNWPQKKVGAGRSSTVQPRFQT